MRVLAALAVVIVALSSCTKREVAPPSADSTAVVDSTTRDSTMMPDSGGKAPTKSKTDSIIGHDSAFGPIGAIDDSGRVVPIRTKRP